MSRCRWTIDVESPADTAPTLVIAAAKEARSKPPWYPREECRKKRSTLIVLLPTCLVCSPWLLALTIPWTRLSLFTFPSVVCVINAYVHLLITFDCMWPKTEKSYLYTENSTLCFTSLMWQGIGLSISTNKKKDLWGWKHEKIEVWPPLWHRSSIELVGLSVENCMNLEVCAVHLKLCNFYHGEATESIVRYLVRPTHLKLSQKMQQQSELYVYHNAHL